MKRKICAAIAILCVLCLLGLAGSSDLNRIGFAGIVAQGIPLAALAFISLEIGGFAK
jgi:hypothetical protein